MSDYTRYITDRSSPLLAHSRFIKATFGDDTGIVFIGPCIAKKREADVWKTIDAALTFNDLRKWLNREGITPGSLKVNTEQHDFIPFRAGKGAYYPVGGGMIESCKKYDPLSHVRTMAITGIEEIRSALEGLKNEDLKEPLFLEVLACEGGCVNGPGTGSSSSLAMRNVRIGEYAETADDTLDEQVLSSVSDLTGTLPVIQQVKTNTARQVVCARSVEDTRADELNCASCGCDTCRLLPRQCDNRAEKLCACRTEKTGSKKLTDLYVQSRRCCHSRQRFKNC